MKVSFHLSENASFSKFHADSASPGQAPSLPCVCSAFMACADVYSPSGTNCGVSKLDMCISLILRIRADHDASCRAPSDLCLDAKSEALSPRLYRQCVDQQIKKCLDCSG